MQAMAAREVSPLDSMVVTVTQLTAGSGSTVAPATAEVVGTLRALRTATFEYGVKRLGTLATSVAGTFSCNATMSWDITPVYPPTVNDPEAWAFAKRVAIEYAPHTGACKRRCDSCKCFLWYNRASNCILVLSLSVVHLYLCCHNLRFLRATGSRGPYCRLFGEESVQEIAPMMAGEDFAFYLQRIPGAMMFLGHFDAATGNSAAQHNPNFFLHEDVLALGAAYHASLATEFLRQGGLPVDRGRASI